MYRVIESFADLKDNKHLYHVGDEFPRDGANVSKSRIDELSGSKNKMRKPLIEQVVAKSEKAEADHTVKPPKKKEKKDAE